MASDGYPRCLENIMELQRENMKAKNKNKNKNPLGLQGDIIRAYFVSPTPTPLFNY
jgi:hypothetical protein